jgi:DNA-binding SARP family transcriptional activator
VARGTQHRKRRPTANARVTQPSHQATATAKPKRVQHQKWEDQLFFARLRNHGKFLWYLLAAALIAAFVLLGVGSGSTGISDILNSFFNRTSASGTALSSLQKQTVEHPKSAKAWLAYANKLQQKDKLDEAAAALTTYTTLRPKDQDALRQLAAIYYRRAVDWETIYSEQQGRTQAIAPAPAFSPTSTSPLGKAVGSLTNPLASAVSSQTSSTTSNAYQQFAGMLTQRVGIWKKLATLNPKDASTQLSLAQAATDAADTAAAIAGYKAYLKLAPQDSGAPAARKALKQLEASAKASASSSTTTTGK